MKNFTLILITLFAISLQANAQIPNGGFEEWDNIGSFQEPVGFLTPNSEAIGPYYPITRSTDHFPASIGDYSIRIENNTSLLPNIDGLGIILQNTSNNLADGPGPTFPIIGHPTSLTGYCKYAPQNGDTMFILILLFNNGTAVAANSFLTTDSIFNWTPFTIPLSNYATADSGSILMGAYYANGHPPQFIPHGNSVLYIDNLNFDDLLTSVPEQNVKNNLFNIFPNPAFNNVTLEIDHRDNFGVSLNIYNIIGEIVRSEKIYQNQHHLNIDNFKSGVYMVEIKTNELRKIQRLIIQK